MNDCLICDADHTYVCDCGHRHDRHNRMGGCKYESCSCECYSQKHQRLPSETTKQYNDRILGNPLKFKKKR